MLNKELVDLVSQIKNNIKPGNFWLDNNNNPNFESNVTNVSKNFESKREIRKG